MQTARKCTHLKEVRSILKNEPNLIELPAKGRAVFVGDTHGDYDATAHVFKKYSSDSTLVFLGDYIDRGLNSQKNIDFLLEQKIRNPSGVILLMGNHEVRGEVNWAYADFWREISEAQAEEYGQTLLCLPMAASGNGIIALHGGLPILGDISDINRICRDKNDARWDIIKWGDYDPHISIDGYKRGGRPQLSREYFKKSMKAVRKNVLIRSHQPDAGEKLFDGRCVTIFTSRYYVENRSVAVADLSKEIRSADDISIEPV